MASIFDRLFQRQRSVRDPVCGMTIPRGRVQATSVHESTTYSFCSRVCKEQFDRDPAKYVSSSTSGGTSRGH